MPVDRAQREKEKVSYNLFIAKLKEQGLTFNPKYNTQGKLTLVRYAYFKGDENINETIEMLKSTEDLVKGVI